jgi:hypothetical protein
MPPALARHFIAEFSSPGDLVLDPFCGKGTTLLEASLLGRRTLGFDVAPEAVIVTSAKLDPPSLGDITDYLSQVRPGRQGLNGTSRHVRTFFHPRTLAQIEALAACLLSDTHGGSVRQRRIATFLLGVLLGILHGHSEVSLSLKCSHSFAMAPRYVRDYARAHGLLRPARDVRECLIRRSRALLLSERPNVRGKAMVSSAQSYPKQIWKSIHQSVDLVLTSPPYLNMQTYPKDAWMRLWLLGYDYKRIRNRFIETGSPTVYVKQLAPCLREILRALKPSAHAVIIAGDAPFMAGGERKVFETARQLAKVAVESVWENFTFDIVGELVDDIPAHSRYYSAVHKDGNETESRSRKGVKVERIIILQKIAVNGRRRHQR